jgi:hypothetical protein
VREFYFIDFPAGWLAKDGCNIRRLILRNKIMATNSTKTEKPTMTAGFSTGKQLPV